MEQRGSRCDQLFETARQPDRIRNICHAGDLPLEILRSWQQQHLRHQPHHHPSRLGHIRQRTHRPTDRQIGGTTVMFVGTGASAGAVNTSNGAQAAAITAIGGAAVEAGAALTAVITPGSIARSGALGGGSVLYRSILSLADQFGFCPVDRQKNRSMSNSAEISSCFPSALVGPRSPRGIFTRIRASRMHG